MSGPTHARRTAGGHLDTGVPSHRVLVAPPRARRLRACRRPRAAAAAGLSSACLVLAALPHQPPGPALARAGGDPGPKVARVASAPLSFPLCSRSDRAGALAALDALETPYVVMVRWGGSESCAAGPLARKEPARGAAEDLRASIPTVALSMYGHMPWARAIVRDGADARAIVGSAQVAHVEVDAPLRWQGAASETGDDTYWRRQLDLQRALVAGADGRGTAVVVAGEPVVMQHSIFGTERSVHAACFSEAGGDGTTMCPDNEIRRVGEGAASRCDDLDWCRHGTEVASQVAASAPGAELIPIVVTSVNPDGPPIAMLSSTVAALDYALGLKEQGLPVRAFEYSYGVPPVEGDSMCVSLYRSMVEGIGAALDAGIAFVAAAGNGGGDLYCPAAMVRGSDPDGILAVAAVNEYDELEPFSSAAPRAIGVSGAGIWCAQPGGEDSTGSGTSLAGGLAAGLVADIGTALPNVSPSDLEGLLVGTGRLVSVPPGGTRGEGYGLPVPQVGVIVGAPGEPPGPQPGRPQPPVPVYCPFALHDHR